MSRELSETLAAEFAGESQQIVLLYEGVFTSGTLRLCSLPYDVSWDGQTWLGAGELLGFSGLEETTELKATGCALSLACNEEIAQLALAQARTGQSGKVWIGTRARRPSLRFAFADAESAVPTIGDATLTVTRAGTNATRWTSGGVLEEVAANTARIDYDRATLECKGLLVEVARTNSIRNNTMVGAVAGVIGAGGALPTNWVSGTALTGLTLEVIGTGNEFNVDYIALRLSGTPSGAGPYAITFDTVAAADGETWTGSLFARLVGGSLSGVSTVHNEVTLRDAGAVVKDSTQEVIVPASAVLPTQRAAGATVTGTDATIATANAAIRFTLSGAAIDFTIRIGLPQLELGANRSSVIKTSGAAATRNADVPVGSPSTFINATEGTLLVEFEKSGFSGNTEMAAALSDGTADANIIAIYVQSGATPNVRFRVTSGAVAQVDIQDGDPAAEDDVVRAVGAYKENDFALSRDGGGVPTTDTSGSVAAGVNKLTIGCRGDGGAQLNGWIRLLDYYPYRCIDGFLPGLSDGEEVGPFYHIVADPYLAFEGRLDVPTIQKGERPVVTIAYESRLRDLERANELRMTDQDHQRLFQGDRFFSRVPSSQEKIVNW